MYSIDGDEMNSVMYKLKDVGGYDVTLQVSYNDTYIGKLLNQRRKRTNGCGDNDVFQIGFEGYFYWFRGGEESVVLNNLDTGAELIISNELEDVCRNFRFGFIDKDNTWKGLSKSSLYIDFLESEAQGLVPGNYSIKINYDLDDGFHESNTFKFEIEE